MHGVIGRSLWLTLEGVSCVCALAADAGKHWNGLIKGYFAERVSRIMAAGLSAAQAGKPLPASTINILMANQTGKVDMPPLTVTIMCTNIWMAAALPVAMILWLPTK